MAEYDGSIRIGVKLQLADTEKQFQHLKDSMIQQTKEVDRQSQAVGKLKDQYGQFLEKNNVKGSLISDLRDAVAEADRLDQALKFAKENAEAFRLANGEASPELLNEVNQLTEQLKQADMRADALEKQFSDLGISPDVADKMDEFSASIYEAETNLEELKNGQAQTEQAMNAAGAEVDRLNECLRQIYDSATVADEGILKLRDELEQLQQRKSDLEAAGVSLGFQEYDSVISRIQEVNRELTEYKKRMKDAGSAHPGENVGWFSRIGQLASRVGKTVTSGFSAAGKAVNGLMSRISALGKNKGLEKTADSAGKLGSRLKTIVTGALFFNVISRGLTALTKQIGAYLTANKDFSSALSGIQSNLLTAFQPIYESVLPALTAMMEAMETVTAKFAAFMATVFGTTAAKAQENAEALYEQANATEETGKAAKKAQKFLASFDTIEKLGSKETGKEESKAAPAFDTAFEGIQAPKWLLDFWKVFQDGWKQYGEPVMAAFKSAIGTIGDLIRAIGALFMSIWTGGTGLDFLGNIAGLLEMVLGIIHDIAEAFMAAWNNTYGQAVLEAMSYALNSVLALLVSIGVAFREAWNDGSGEQICATILSILTNIFNIVGNLANRLREAWEANGNGVAIWNTILDIVQDVLDFFNEITLATAQWTEGLDLEPIVSGFRAFLAAVEPLVDLLLGGLSWAWENILLPLAGWVIEDAAPAAVDFLSSALGTLVQILSALAPLFQVLWSVMKPVAEFMGGAFVEALNALASVIQMVGDALTWLINLTTQIASVNAKTLFGIDIGGGGTAKTRSAYALPQSYAYDSAAVADAFPHLAGGAVIAPNHEFLAVLGDQKSGTNIETPLSTMKQAFLEAIAESGITRQSGGGGVAELTLDGQKFARLIFPYTQGEQSRRGVNLVMGGA